MAKAPTEPLFLAKETYRRRRIGDAARFLPFMGLALMLMPVLWSNTAITMVYVFVVWAFLILLAGVLSIRLTATEPDGEAPRPDVPPEP